MASYADFAASLVATAPSPATSGTSLVVTAGEGARFPTTFPFDVEIWPGPLGSVLPAWAAGGATGGNVETAICTTRTGDTLTLTRAQRGTTARTIVVGDVVVLPVNASLLSYLESRSPTGVIEMWCSRVLPANALWCDGVAKSRTTYPNLYAKIVPNMGTVTVTIASPGVATLTSHGLLTGDPVFFTTTGALPTGLVANTLYYAIRIDADTFNLATSRANAIASTKINTSGTQSGVHTLWDCPHGLGDGSTTFNTPDIQSRVPVGAVNGTGGHSDITQGNTEGVALANRHSKHNTTNSLTLPNHIHSHTFTLPTHAHSHSLTLPNHVHTINSAGGGGSLTLTNTQVTNAQSTWTTNNPTTNPAIGGSVGNNSSAPAIDGAVGNPTTNPAISGTAGPGGTLPIDTPAFIVLPYIIWT